MRYLSALIIAFFAGTPLPAGDIQPSANSINSRFEASQSVTSSPPSREDAIRNLRAAVCKVKIPQSGHGSGVAYGRNGEWTYILTAAHVVRALPADIRHISRYTIVWSWGEKDINELAEVYAIDRTCDLAILRVKNSIQPVAKLSENWPQKPGIEMLACGYPASLYPSVISYGFLTNTAFIGEDHVYYQYSAATYFGNSGGAIVRFDTLEIIGIVVQYAYISDPWRGDTALAEPLEHIHAFLARIHLPAEEKANGASKESR